MEGTTPVMDRIEHFVVRYVPDGDGAPPEELGRGRHQRRGHQSLAHHVDRLRIAGKAGTVELVDENFDRGLGGMTLGAVRLGSGPSVARGRSGPRTDATTHGGRGRDGEPASDGHARSPAIWNRRGRPSVRVASGSPHASQVVHRSGHHHPPSFARRRRIDVTAPGCGRSAARCPRSARTGSPRRSPPAPRPPAAATCRCAAAASSPVCPPLATFGLAPRSVAKPASGGKGAG